MREERLAVLSMVEKGIITVDEAERLLRALNETALSDKAESMFSKAGENIGTFAKSAAEKAEKIIEDAKPKVKKAVDDASPKVKKFSEKASEFTNRIIKRKNDEDEEITDDDFEKNINIIPLDKQIEEKPEQESGKTEEKSDENDEKE
ncbi:hypothetical protein MUJ63_04050 [Lachnospiraceae bacterium NSJ-143]|nr:hypothetical protein [Lachnospiraceae bacterium NSJ-143]